MSLLCGSSGLENKIHVLTESKTDLAVGYKTERFLMLFALSLLFFSSNIVFKGLNIGLQKL